MDPALASRSSLAPGLFQRAEGGDDVTSQVTGLRVASVVFGLMAVAQLVRLVIRPEVLVSGYSMPLWPSVLAFVILGGLSLWMWKLGRT